MKTVKVFLVDESDKVIQEHEYTVVKTIKDTHDFSTMFVAGYDGDFAVIRASKDYSVNPFRYVVRRKILIPFFMDQGEDE